MWKTDGFAVNDKVLDEQELWVDRYERLEHETVQHNEENEEIYKQSELGVIGDCIYRYSGVIDSLNGEYLRSVIEYTDITSMKTDSMEFTSEQMGKRQTPGMFCRWMYMVMAGMLSSGLGMPLAIQTMRQQ